MGWITEEEKTLPVTGLGRENPVPLFREFPPHKVLPFPGAQNAESVGIDNARRLLPYKEQGSYAVEAKGAKIRQVTLENEHLKAVFLPDWGGRLLSLFDKQAQKDLLYNPRQIILGNLAIRNAWFAGGIEWNLGYLGHSVSTCSPVNCVSIKDESGDTGLRLYHFERMQELWWQIDFFLPTGAQMLEACVHLYNDNSLAKPLYWWTNIAITEEKQKRILSSEHRAACRSNIAGGFDDADFPSQEKYPGIDFSYSTNYPQSMEFFFDKAAKGPHWIASVDAQGQTFFETSSAGISMPEGCPFRKIFCWGTHQGGKNWQKLLHRGRGQSYLEIQAGLARTQNHLARIPAKSSLSWTHWWGACTIDPQKAHQKDWSMAANYFQTVLEKKLSSCSGKPRTERQQGHPSGTLHYLAPKRYWGALHYGSQKESILPPWLSSTIKTAALPEAGKRWQNLLHERSWKAYEPQDPIEWVLGTSFQRAFENLRKEGREDWSVFLHLGVIHREKFDFNKALEYFEKSRDLKENPFAYWGLCETQALLQDRPKTRTYGLRCLSMADSLELKLAILKLFLHFEFWDALRETLEKFSTSEREDLRLLEIRLPLAIHEGKLEQALNLVQTFSPYIREGSFTLHRYWKQIQEALGRQDPLPAALDFWRE